MEKNTKITLLTCLSVCVSGSRVGGFLPWRGPSLSEENHDGGDGVDGVRAADGSDGPQILRAIEHTSHHTLNEIFTAAHGPV